MLEYDHDRWHDDHDRQERGRIAQIRHAYGPDDNWARISLASCCPQFFHVSPQSTKDRKSVV